MLGRLPTALFSITLAFATPTTASAQGTLWRAGLNLGLGSFTKGGGGGTAYRLGSTLGAELERPVSGAFALVLGLGYSQRRFGSPGGTVTSAGFTFDVTSRSYDFDYIEAIALWRWHVSSGVQLDLGPALGRLTHCAYNGDTPCYDQFFPPPFTPNRLDYSAMARLIMTRPGTGVVAGYGLAVTQGLRTTNGGTVTTTFAPGGGIAVSYADQIRPRIASAFALVRL
jgi:hypothetical protein